VNSSHIVPIVIIVAAVAFSAWRRRRRRGTDTPRRPVRSSARLHGVTWLVAESEFRQRVRGRAFRLATLFVLLAVAAAIAVPSLTKGSAKAQRVGVVGTLSAAERSGVTALARSVGTGVRLVPEADTAAASAALKKGSIDLAVVDGTSVLVHKTLANDDTSTTAQLARAVARTLGTARAINAAGLSQAQVADLAAAQPVPISAVQVSTKSAINKPAVTAGAILVFILLTQYLSWTLTGVMQEKANRVVEVLLATVRPLQLLTGKLLGIAAVVFGQAALVVAVAFGVGKGVGSDLIHGAGPELLGSQFLWLVLGYALYSWLYAAVGSMVERQDQVQSLALPLVIPLVFGYIIALTSAGSGSPSTLLKVLAYLPPTAPFAMPVLAAFKAVSWWQYLISIAIMLAAIAGAARLAAGIYRRAILRTGRRVHFRELFHSSS